MQVVFFLHIRIILRNTTSEIQHTRPDISLTLRPLGIFNVYVGFKLTSSNRHFFF